MSFKVFASASQTMRAARGKPLLDETSGAEGHACTWNPLEFVAHVSGWFTYEEQWKTVLRRAVPKAD